MEFNPPWSRQVLMVARIVASSVDDVSCLGAWLRQVLMWLGGWWSDLAREYCGSGRCLVGTGYGPSVVLGRIFMANPKATEKQNNFVKC